MEASGEPERPEEGGGAGVAAVTVPAASGASGGTGAGGPSGEDGRRRARRAEKREGGGSAAGGRKDAGAPEDGIGERPTGVHAVTTEPSRLSQPDPQDGIVAATRERVRRAKRRRAAATKIEKSTRTGDGRVRRVMRRE
jgi:hypothetical protein